MKSSLVKVVVFFETLVLYIYICLFFNLQSFMFLQILLTVAMLNSSVIQSSASTVAFGVTESLIVC